MLNGRYRNAEVVVHDEDAQFVHVNPVYHLPQPNKLRPGRTMKFSASPKAVGRFMSLGSNREISLLSRAVL
jgi:hypothetical protein